MSGGGRRALFLDRDGVINHEVGFLHRPVDVRWVQGIFSLCRTAEAQGYVLVVVTNQSGIGRGLYSTDDFWDLMHWMQAEFRQEGIALNNVYFCPYHPTDGLGAWRREHADRKPGPGMLLRAAADLELDVRESILVGDRCSDLAAAAAAGLRQSFLLSGTEGSPCPQEALRVQSLAEVERWLEADAAARTKARHGS